MPWQHILLRVLRQNLVLEIINDVTVMSFCNQSQQNFVFFACNTNKHLCTKFEQNRKRNKEVARNGKLCHCVVISENGSTVFVFGYFSV